jgi:hypothetical protein
VAQALSQGDAHHARKTERLDGVTQQDTVFRVTFSRLIWRVTLDGAFFGDYRSKQNALKSIEEAQQKNVSLRRAKVLFPGAET